MRITIFDMLAIAGFAAATCGADVAVRIMAGGESLGRAVSEYFYNLAAQPLITALLFTPFLALARISDGVARKTRKRIGFGLFAIFGTILIFLYFVGYQEARRAEIEHKWTAAALAIGLLPVFSLPVLAVALVAGLIAGKVGQRHKG